jgi:predicted phosphodiesterase
MNISDFAIETFLFFRLGNSPKVPEMLHHFSLQVEREIHQQEDVFTGEDHVEDPSNKLDEKLGSKKTKNEVYTKISHNHSFKQVKHVASLTSEAKSYDEIHQSQSSKTTASGRIVRVMVISDTHERHHTLGNLPPCDILIHAGDILMTSRVQSSTKVKTKLKKFNDWMKEQSASCKIVIGGNHDKLLEELSSDELSKIFTDCTYLCNDGIEAMGLKIWASPCSQGASDNRAFQSREFRAAAKEAARRAGPVDILVTHGTCSDLQNIVNPRLMHVFGHYHCYHGLNIHENEYSSLVSVAAPIMDHQYNPYNFPIAIDCEINDDMV